MFVENMLGTSEDNFSFKKGLKMVKFFVLNFSSNGSEISHVNTMRMESSF
jgi:hypothetical protein